MPMENPCLFTAFLWQERNKLKIAYKLSSNITSRCLTHKDWAFFLLFYFLAISHISKMFSTTFRQLAVAAASTSRLTRFALHPPKSVEVEFCNGNKFNLSAEYLRVYSPAADSKLRLIAGQKVIFGRRHVGIMSAETVGNYGVKINFDDLHKTGIYTWDYLYHLGANKFALMRNYLKTLKKYGLSRDSQRRK